MTTPAHTAAGIVLNGYAGLPAGFDELVTPDGGVRSHWHTFARGLDDIGLEEFTNRWREAQQLIRDEEAVGFAAEFESKIIDAAHIQTPDHQQ